MVRKLPKFGGRLRYYTIGIKDPVISVDGDKGMITY